MRTQDIQVGDWVSFFDAFSRRHAGWLATVAILGSDGSVGLEARQLPLAGITVDVIDASRIVSIMLGGNDPQHLTRVIRAPTSVVLKQTEVGADEAVIIESADGTKTILRFRSALLPEMVDGVLP
jgi:hypothetical protein